MKTYDRVEWSYLHGCLCKLGFDEGWIQSVMRCVTCVRYVVRVNGELTYQLFHPEVFVKGILSALIYFFYALKVCLTCCNNVRTEVSSMEFAMVDLVPYITLTVC
jgi:hypothetical protein